jgi:endonuclease YncB( thermonuclease family)
MRPISAALCSVLLVSAASVAAQREKNPDPPQGKPKVVRDRVKGSIHHGAGKSEWERITGKVRVIDAATLRFEDGTPIEFNVVPELDEKGKQEATVFLRELVGGRPVTSFGYVGDTNLQHAMIINGWGLANHSSLHPAEVIARETKRGFWRDKGVAPGKTPEPVEGRPKVVRDRVKGSLHHDKGKREWDRITGKARVIDAHTLQFEDGTRILLHVVAPELDQAGMIGDSLYPCGKEAAAFLRALIGDQPVMCFLVEAQDDKWIGYVGDTNLGHALVINGWGLAHHSSLHPAEITARENKRGLWRGKFLDPVDWRAGKRLPGEK